MLSKVVPVVLKDGQNGDRIANVDVHIGLTPPTEPPLGKASTVLVV